MEIIQNKYIAIAHCKFTVYRFFVRLNIYGSTRIAYIRYITHSHLSFATIGSCFTFRSQITSSMHAVSKVVMFVATSNLWCYNQNFRLYKYDHKK